MKKLVSLVLMLVMGTFIAVGCSKPAATPPKKDGTKTETKTDGAKTDAKTEEAKK